MKALGLIEKVVRLASVLTLAVLMPLKIVATHCGWDYPPALNSVVLVLMAAAVGYVTNWIAVEMLFKPYEKSPSHPFSILTFGYWQQGLVPRNKDKIGEQLGKETEKRLLNVAAIAQEFCGMVPGLLRDKELMAKVTGGIKAMLQKYRDPIVDKITGGIRQRCPQLMEIAQHELSAMINRKVDETPAFAAVGMLLPFNIGDFAVSCVDWQAVEQRVKFKLAEPATQDMIGEELDKLVDSCTAWIERDLAPMLEPYLRDMANGPLKDKIVAKLDLANRVADAVRKQDVREFHTMINNLAAKHLVAIQVLGYALGLLVGLVQLAG